MDNIMLDIRFNVTPNWLTPTTESNRIERLGFEENVREFEEHIRYLIEQRIQILVAESPS